MNQSLENTGLTDALLRRAASLPRDRVVMLEHDKIRYWVKFREDLKTLRHRILKGNAHASFAREQALLAAFAKRGAPVPRIVAQTEDCIILSDHGPDLTTVLPQTPDPGAVLYRVGAALAGMHAAGLAHGRPCIRDICWDDNVVTFLDLEAGARVDATPRRQARDLLLLVHSLLTGEPDQHAHATAILEGYLSADRRNVWSEARAMAKRLYWLELLVMPIIWRHRQRGKTSSEFYAVPATRRLINSYAPSAT